MFVAVSNHKKLSRGESIRRLDELGFTIDDLKKCEAHGYAPSDILRSVEVMLDLGVTTEGYARRTFEEANPEIFAENSLEPLPDVPLVYNSDDKPKLVIENFVAIMKSDPKYAGIRFNDLGNRAEVHTVADGKLTIVPWSDADEAQSMNYIESKYGLYSKDKHSAALRILFNERRYNPIRDIVDNVEWDGKERCKHFLNKWGKVEDSAYTQEVSRLIFAGGIHRLYEPGCKFEDIPILIGDQGCGKSTLCRYLAVNDDYFGELKIMEGQAAIENLSGKWVLEIPEMSAFTKAKDQEAIKAFVSRQRDSYRKPYDRNTTELLRRCVFLATSNDRNPLVDKTGNRRWYPVECHCNGYDIYDHEAEIRDYIMQCWAEAREHLHSSLMQPFADRKLLDQFREAQDNAMQDDWRVGAIQAFLDHKNPGELTCVRELCHRALSPNPDFPKEPSLVESKDIGKIMDRLKNWKRVGNKRLGSYGVQKCWQKLGDPDGENQNKSFWEE